MKNFLFGFNSQYMTIYSSEFGNNIDEKLSIIKFYGKKETDPEELIIADLYIVIKEKNDS